MGVAEEILVLIKYSPKREDIIGCIKEQMEFESEPEEKANDITKKKKITSFLTNPFISV